MFEELRRASLQPRGKETAAAVGCSLLWAELSPNAQLEAEAQLTKLEEELRV